MKYLHANNKGADQPPHPRSLIITFVVRCLESIIDKLATGKKNVIIQLISVTEQIGLIHVWSETPKAGFLTLRPIYQSHDNFCDSVLFPSY